MCMGAGFSIPGSALVLVDAVGLPPLPRLARVPPPPPLLPADAKCAGVVLVCQYMVRAWAESAALIGEPSMMQS
jgi:hypothetical protein